MSAPGSKHVFLPSPSSTSALSSRTTFVTHPSITAGRLPRSLVVAPCFITVVVTRTTGRSAPFPSRRGKTGSKVTEHDREDERIPTSGWLDGKILAYQLKEKEFRRGLIVESSGNCSTLVPIKTYSRRGCSHLQEEQKLHSAIYVGSRPPSTEQEPYLRVAIQASRLDVENSAKPRINYDGKFNLRHTTRVREVGQVSGRHFQVLLKQYREVHGIAQESTAAPSRSPLAPSDAKPPTRVEDHEESGPQPNGDKNNANPARIQTSDLAAVHSLADTPQMQQQPKAISSATTPSTPPNELSGPSEAPPLPINESRMPPHSILKASCSDPLLQQGNTEIHKTPYNDVENRATSPPLVTESGEVASSASPTLKPQQPVETTQDDLSTVALPARTTPPTVAVETSLSERDHLTLTEAICPISDTTSEEVTGSGDLSSVSQTINTVSVSEGVNFDVHDLPQMMGMIELHKEATTPIQETNDAVPHSAKRQDMWYTLDYIVPPFSLQDMVASLNFPSLTADTNLPQPIDATFPQESDEHASAPSAAAKSKQRAVDSIPPFRLSFSIPTVLLLPLLLIIRGILQLCRLPNNIENRRHRPQSPTEMHSHPTLGDEPNQTCDEHQNHTTAEDDPAYPYYQHKQATNQQTIYSPQSLNPAATVPYSRSPPPSDWCRSIWLQDERFKSTIQVWALIDTGADDNFISEQALQPLDVKVNSWPAVVTYGNGQTQQSQGAVWLHFGLNSQPHRWQDRFIVVAGLPYDVVFGKDLNTRLNFIQVNPKMLILMHGKNGKPDSEAIEENERQKKEHDKQLEEQNERENEERAARRRQMQHQTKGLEYKMSVSETR